MPKFYVEKFRQKLQSISVRINISRALILFNKHQYLNKMSQ